MHRVSICCALSPCLSHFLRSRKPRRNLASTANPGGTTSKSSADDNMEGRETGSDGSPAQAFVVEQLRRTASLPLARRLYQPVQLIERQVVRKDCLRRAGRDGKSESLVPGDEIPSR